MMIIRLFTALTGASLVSAVVSAQPPAPQGMLSAIDRFAANAPSVGELIPDLTIVDRNGDPVSLRELTRENYAVFVLGCLT